MPYNDDENHSPSFTILNKQMTQINTAERLAAKAFLVFSTKSQQIAIQHKAM